MHCIAWLFIDMIFLKTFSKIKQFVFLFLFLSKNIVLTYIFLQKSLPDCNQVLKSIYIYINQFFIRAFHLIPLFREVLWTFSYNIYNVNNTWHFFNFMFSAVLCDIFCYVFHISNCACMKQTKPRQASSLRRLSQ